MVICTFFQQGNCRYGQRCRFEHVYGSKYTYNAGSGGALTDDKLAAMVRADVQDVLAGGAWPLSCFGPFKERPSVPGLPDLSPEEARLFMYEARATNTVESAVARYNGLLREARALYERLRAPDADLLRTLRRLHDGAPAPAPTPAPALAPADLFRSAAAAPAVAGSAGSIFSAAVRDAFGASSAAPTDIFAAASREAFPRAAAADVFGPGARGTEPAAEAGVHSAPEMLSEEELLAFRAEEFALWRVPESAPPSELCAP